MGYELTFKTSLGEWKQSKLTQQQMTGRDLHKTIGNKFQFQEADSKDLIEFLVHLDAIGKEIPTVKLYTKMGWKDNFTSFIIGNKKYTSDENVVEDVEITSIDDTDKYIKALTPKGTVEGWKDGNQLLLKYDPVRMVFYIATDAMLKELLHINSSVHNQENSSSKGKTTSCQSAMSMFGDSNILSLPGDNTKNFFDMLLNTLNNIPMFVDDIQEMKEEDKEPFIYSIGNNSSRGRQKIDLKLREPSTWRTNVLSTSENPLTNDSARGGLKVRGIDYPGGIGEVNAETTIAVKKFEAYLKSNDNYGVLAPLLARKIMKHSADLITRYKENCNKIVNALSENGLKDNNIVNRMSDQFGSAILAGEIFEEVMEDINIDKKDPLEVVIPIAEKIIKQTATETFAFRALKAIYSEVEIYADHYEIDDTKTSKYPRDGTYGGLRDGRYLEIYISYFEKMMDKFEFNYKGVRNELKRENIEPDWSGKKNGYYSNPKGAKVVSIDTKVVYEKYKLSNPLLREYAGSKINDKKEENNNQNPNNFTTSDKKEGSKWELPFQFKPESEKNKSTTI